MITITITVTPECEDLITNMPRGYEYEIASEEYDEDGAGVVTVIVHDVDDTTAAMEQALDTNPEVISYSVTR